MLTYTLQDKNPCDSCESGRLDLPKLPKQGTRSGHQATKTSPHRCFTNLISYYSLVFLCLVDCQFHLLCHGYGWSIERQLYSGNMHSGFLKLNRKRIHNSFGWNIDQSNSRNILAGRMNHTFFDTWCVGCWIRLSIWKRSDGCPRSGFHTIVWGITQDHPLIALLCQS